MFKTSYFDTLQDYLASGCTMELTAEEQDYYNALYALVGIHRKYGKDNAIAFLMHPPFNVERGRAQRMYAEALNLFYLNDTVENDAYRNIIFDDLMKAALVVLQNATTSKDMEVYGNLKTQAAKIKQLDKRWTKSPSRCTTSTRRRWDWTLPTATRWAGRLTTWTCPNARKCA